MRNATSILLFGASSLVLSVGACGGGGSGSRDEAMAGSTSNPTAGNASSGSGPTSNMAGNSSSGAGGGGTGGAKACAETPGSKKGDGTALIIDEIDDTDTMFS